MKTVAPPIGEPSAPRTRPERLVLAAATFAKSATANAAEDHALRQLVIPRMIPPARGHYANLAYHPPTPAAMGATNSPGEPGRRATAHKPGLFGTLLGPAGIDESLDTHLPLQGDPFRNGATPPTGGRSLPRSFRGGASRLSPVAWS